MEDTFQKKNKHMWPSFDDEAIALFGGSFPMRHMDKRKKLNVPISRQIIFFIYKYIQIERKMEGYILIRGTCFQKRTLTLGLLV